MRVIYITSQRRPPHPFTCNCHNLIENLGPGERYSSVGGENIVMLESANAPPCTTYMHNMSIHFFCGWTWGPTYITSHIILSAWLWLSTPFNMFPLGIHLLTMITAWETITEVRKEGNLTSMLGHAPRFLLTQHYLIRCLCAIHFYANPQKRSFKPKSTIKDHSLHFPAFIMVYSMPL